MSVGEVAGPLSMSSGQVVYQVESREPPKEEELVNQKEAIRERLLNQKRQLAFAVFQDNLMSRLTASGELKDYRTEKTYRDAVDRLLTAYR